MKLLNIFLLVLILTFPTLAQQSKRVTSPKDLIKFLKVRSRDIQVKAADINGDNKPEYFVKKIRNCGPGRCETTLYQRQGGKFIKLFSSSAIWFDVGKGSRNGMRNLVDYDWLIGDFTYGHYQWDGDGYIPTGCTIIIKSGKNKGKHQNVPCSE